MKTTSLCFPATYRRNVDVIKQLIGALNSEELVSIAMLKSCPP